MTINRRALLQVTITAAAMLCLAAGANAQQAIPPVTAITGANLVGIDGEPAIQNAVVLIEGERIKQIGPAASVQIPAGAKTVPLNGKWLLPGLMNMHVHLSLNLPGATRLYNETDPQMILRMARNARLSLLSGVTTVRLVGERGGGQRFRLEGGDQSRRCDRAAHRDGRCDHRADRRPRLSRSRRSGCVGQGGTPADQAGRELDQDRDLGRHCRHARRHQGGADDRCGNVDDHRGGASQRGQGHRA